MSTAVPLEQLTAQGQSVWYDNISRDLLVDGGLQRLVDDFAVRGVTSNPTILQKAMTGSALYDGEIAETGDLDAEETFLRLAVSDIRGACDVLLPLWQGTGGADGFVSLEVSPHLARDAEGTIKDAARIYDLVDRPNVMIKIPGTAEGIPAVEETIAAGINVNVTLLFSVDRHMEAAEAYLRGLERAREAGHDLSRIASVASFFVSRVDTKVDGRLDGLGDGAGALRGRAAVANAKLAYAAFQEAFSGHRWETLAGAGARAQRPLWASTSTKNPEYSDVLYVEPLIGPHTVNTMPHATLDAFADHGAAAGTIDIGVEESRRFFEDLASQGIVMAQVAHELEVEGVQAFVDSYDEVVGAVASRKRELVAT